jgi:hypothetical protein
MNRYETALRNLKEGTVIPAIPLALHSNRTFHEEGQRRLMKYYLNAFVGGVAVAVHTTQFEIRNPEINLLKPVLTVAAEEITKYEQETGKTIIRVAGVCGKTEQAVSEAKLAKSLGYDAVLLSPGGLLEESEEYLIERTQTVAEVIPVIGFYLQTACGGRRLSYEYWRAVADTPNVVAIKCASFNRYQTIDLVRGVAASKRSEEVALYTGNDDNIVVDLLTPFRFTMDGKQIEKRFVGGLLGHWSLWTNTVVKLFSEIKKYQNESMIPSDLLSLAVEVTDCNGAFFDVANNFAGCIPGVHEILMEQGLMDGIWCLNEEEVLSENQLEEIKRVEKMYPHLTDNDFVKSFLAQI